MIRSLLSAALVLGIASCAGTPTGSDHATAAAPSAAHHGNVLSHFSGTADPIARTMTILSGDGSSSLTSESSIPTSGSGPRLPESAGTVVMHTVPGSVSYGTGLCAAGTLCGNVQAVSGLSVPATFYVYIDSVSATGVSGGPWSYLNVAAGGTTASQIWSFSDVSATSFSFQGHVEVVFKNCGILNSQLPSVGSGLTEINPGGTTISAYCDMADYGGGWTQVVYDQSGVGVPQATWLAGTGTAPNTGQYSILNLLPNLKNGTNYQFWLDWGATGYVQWTQVQSPTAVSTAASVTLVGSPLESPVGQTGCPIAPTVGSPFSGLYTSPSPQMALNADAHGSPCGWWAVGETDTTQIAAYSNSTTVSLEKLWVK